MELNKNISVWRGNNTPPTDYHLWEKEDGSLHTKINKEWFQLTSPSDKLTLDRIEQIADKLNKLQIEEVSASGEDVLRSYQLKADGDPFGVVIDIPKDKALKDIQLGYDNASVDSSSGTINIGTPSLGETDPQYMIYSMAVSDGTFTMVKVDLSKFISEKEYSDGLEVDGSKLKVKKDSSSEDYLSISSNGVKVSGINDKFNKIYNDISSIPIEGKINLTNITNIELVKKFNETENNKVKFYIISDSHGIIPSTETRVNINSSIISLVGEHGANVGDIFVIGKLNNLPIYRIIPLNDSKAETSDYRGTIGVMTPGDKAKINKIDAIETAVNEAKNRLPSYTENNINNALFTGIYPWCTLGRPENSKGAYTCITVCTTTKDNQGYDTIEQTIYSRQEELGKVFKRIIFKSSSETQFGQWIEISSTGYVSQDMFMDYIEQKVDKQQGKSLVDNVEITKLAQLNLPDSELKESENTVQNKTVKLAIDNINTKLTWTILD